ncbi:MAG TPA: hypothetical protein VII40_19975 [Xanthobacteraceae bacterium]
MTFALVRAGLPNTVAVLALAMTPLIASAFAPSEQTRHRPAASIGATISAAATASSAGERAMLD